MSEILAWFQNYAEDDNSILTLDLVQISEKSLTFACGEEEITIIRDDSLFAVNYEGGLLYISNTRSVV